VGQPPCNRAGESTQAADIRRDARNGQMDRQRCLASGGILADDAAAQSICVHVPLHLETRGRPHPSVILLYSLCLAGHSSLRSASDNQINEGSLLGRWETVGLSLCPTQTCSETGTEQLSRGLQGNSMPRSHRSISLGRGALRDRYGRRGATQTRLVISPGRRGWMRPPYNAPKIRFT